MFAAFSYSHPQRFMQVQMSGLYPVGHFKSVNKLFQGQAKLRLLSFPSFICVLLNLSRLRAGRRKFAVFLSFPYILKEL
jgi:hypothetical protein